MNAVGIDVSKGRSTVAILRPMGEVVQTPIDVRGTMQSVWNVWRISSSRWVKIRASSWRQQADTTNRLPENCTTMGYLFLSSIPLPSTGIAQAVLSARSKTTERML